MPARVALYYADQRSLTEDAAADLLANGDYARLTPRMNERRQAEVLAGRALLRYALAEHTGRSPQSFRIETADNGKPACAGGPSFNISHSGDLVVCAVADGVELGIDVETGRLPSSLLELVQRYFTPAEAAWLAADPEPRFRMLWVLKEAYLKALGTGLAGGLSSLECRVEPPSIHASAGRVAQFALYAAGGDGFVAVAALDSSPVEVTVRRYTPNAPGGASLDFVAAT